MDLKCRKLDCKYNNRYSCESDSIKVTRDHRCATYQLAEMIDEKQRQDVSKTMFEAAPDLHSYRHNKDVLIDCSAKCLFNRNTHCVANGICVSSQDVKTAGNVSQQDNATCVTFAPK